MKRSPSNRNELIVRHQNLIGIILSRTTTGQRNFASLYCEINNIIIILYWGTLLGELRAHVRKRSFLASIIRIYVRPPFVCSSFSVSVHPSALHSNPSRRMAYPSENEKERNRGKKEIEERKRKTGNKRLPWTIHRPILMVGSSIVLENLWLAAPWWRTLTLEAEKSWIRPWDGHSRKAPDAVPRPESWWVDLRDWGHGLGIRFLYDYVRLEEASIRRLC